MQRVTLHTDEPLDAQLQPAADALRQGHLVAFPTETVYGLGANALDDQAIAGIFAAKGRPATNPLIVHVASWEMIEELVEVFEPVAKTLAEAFWPGPLTIICPKSNKVSDRVTAGLSNVAIRWPAHPVAQSLIRLANVPIAAPSANRYTQTSPTMAQHVVDSLGERVAWVVDGGSTTVGLESTVVRVEDGQVSILRPGMLDIETLRAVVPDIIDAPAHQVVEGQAATSPGLAKKHYAPGAPLYQLDASQWAMLLDILSGPTPPEVPNPLVLIACGEDNHTQQHDWGHHLNLPEDADGYAREFYRTLHHADKLGAATIILQTPPPVLNGSARWRAISDRFQRAITETPALWLNALLDR